MANKKWTKPLAVSDDLTFATSSRTATTSYIIKYNDQQTTITKMLKSPTKQQAPLEQEHSVQSSEAHSTDNKRNPLCIYFSWESLKNTKIITLLTNSAFPS